MTSITKNQIKQLHALCLKRFKDREERLAFFSQFTGEVIQSSKDLTQIQAYQLIHYFKTGQRANPSIYALFDKDNPQHKAVLSLAHQLGWVQVQKRHLVDLKILGSWVMSHRCPVQKPLLIMTKVELSKVIYALEQVLDWKYKS